MMLDGWRDATVTTLADKVGPLSEILVDEVLREIGIEDWEMITPKYLQFTHKLYYVLPDDINREEMCRTLEEQVLDFYKK